MKLLMTLFAAAIAVAPMAYAEPAADEPSPAELRAYEAYLTEITSHGVAVGKPEKIVGLGKVVCYNLMHGFSIPEIIRSQFGWFAPGVGIIITDAAQHQLCPNTLEAPPAES